MAAMALAVGAMPASAQNFSNGYAFIKAVKDRDGDKVTSFLATPGTTVTSAKEQPTGNGALHIVTLDRDATWLNFLASKGVKVDQRNSEGFTPLAMAAQLGWLEGAELLARRGANLNIQNNRGETPLILAVQKRDVPMVRLLLARGANVKITDNVAGYSALDYAKQDGRAAPILKLLEAPTKPDKPMQGPKL
jgi:ankyrin repeat protein